MSSRNKRKGATLKAPAPNKKAKGNESDADTNVSSPGLTTVEASKSYKNPDFQRKKDKNLKQILAADKNINWPPNMPTYSSIEAPPSLKPAHKYCDLTGLPANYTDPRTKMRYHSCAEYQKIQDMPDDVTRGYIALRNVVLENMLQ
eukprot:comp14069_c0_seq1/m.9932 comp14069_c0_seq1/g.9932  ORF comp14069_c0_seq1/g.9932 comp14069_c0_seq1/m.9932 type:complete len:146 (-) comp14069_c0_seq1:71-508(-)